jgi:serine/threonine-protein kinase
MGSVYQVEHAVLGRACALKVLHGSVLQRDAHSIDRFLREARAAARIKHPNIVDVFDFGYLADGRPYFVMELLAGTSLGTVIDRGALAPAQAIAFARQLCEALAVAHDHGVIHADVTPSNVFVIADDHVKLVDFGLAELRDPTAAREVASDYVLGTPCYISPEQIRGLPADERSDQYSLGVVLFEMIAGKPPFSSENVRELCLKHLHEPVPELISKFGALPDEMCRLVARCMSKSPASRFPSMRALLMELDEAAKLCERRGWRRWLKS